MSETKNPYQKTTDWGIETVVKHLANDGSNDIPVRVARRMYGGVQVTISLGDDKVS